METTQNTKKKAIVEWIKDHKKEIIVTGVLTTLGLIGIHKIKKATAQYEADVASGKTTSWSVKNLEVPEELRNLGVDDITRLGSGPRCSYELMTGFADENGRYPMKIQDIDILKDSLMKLEGITQDSDIWMEISVGADLGNIPTETV